LGVPALQALQYNDKAIKLHIIGPEQSYIDLEDITLIGRGNTEEKALENLIKKEDRLFTYMMLKASGLVNSICTIKFSEEGINKNDLEILQYEVERHRLLVDKFLIPRIVLGDMKRNFNDIDFDPITSRDLLLSGIFGSIWGVNIYCLGLDMLPFKVIFAVSDTRYLGFRRFKSIDISNSIENSFEIKLVESLCISNPRAIACSIESTYTTSHLNYNKITDIFKKI